MINFNSNNNNNNDNDDNNDNDNDNDNNNNNKNSLQVLYFIYIISPKYGIVLYLQCFATLHQTMNSTHSQRVFYLISWYRDLLKLPFWASEPFRALQIPSWKSFFAFSSKAVLLLQTILPFSQDRGHQQDDGTKYFS